MVYICHQCTHIIICFTDQITFMGFWQVFCLNESFTSIEKSIILRIERHFFNFKGNVILVAELIT